MIQTNIQMMRKHSTYADLLERIQRELYLIRGKYIKLNPTINEDQLKNIMKPHWSRNVPNQQQWHQHFKAQQQPAPIINKYDTDVTMRSRSTENTGNTGKGPQINIGRGRVVRELYNQEIHQDDEK
ncbi:hypothetical protein EVAR_88547_1 [Eumeta japonica]|uniref:Uncharacterized protein n=1 Tax=Eumeta variegata TaxID=151549 RepID=A0A4C1WMW3_EUMVA|nr:hypothetical protein EVAR_88547_1 [Eumeta japonica]